MDRKIKILGIIGSIRSNYKHIDQLKEIINDSESIEDLVKLIKKSKINFSNTDISVSFSMMGAKKFGAKIDLISITDIFTHDKLDIYYNLLKYDSIDDINEIDTLSIDVNGLDRLLKKVLWADGIVMGTPVYFGDRSSVANKFLQLTRKYDSLKGKAFGIVSVGAKRNGGQETANIYSLYEALMQGAVVVGDGPEISQYGGTVWAGDTGDAINDYYGAKTCFGVGRQVCQLSRILKKGNIENKTKLKVTFLLTMDTEDKKYEKILRNYTCSVSKDNNIYIVICNLIDNDIYRCIACNICPLPGTEDRFKKDDYPYKCVIRTKKDDMKKIQKILVESDCVVIAGVNSQEELIYRYQAFMERTRFIRRDHFELTNIPIIGLLINELGANSNQIFNLKVLSSFIRHNTFFLKPLEIYLYNNKIIFENNFKELIPLINSIKIGRSLVEPVEISYKATGYKYKDLDYTFKKRK